MRVIALGALGVVARIRLRKNRNRRDQRRQPQGRRLNAVCLLRGFSRRSAGAINSLFDNFHFVHTVERRHCLKIAGFNEIAWRMCLAPDAAVERLPNSYVKSFRPNRPGVLKKRPICLSRRPASAVEAADGVYD